MKAGETGDDDTYPEGTVNNLIMKRLGEIADAMEKKKDKEQEHDTANSTVVRKPESDQGPD